MKLIKAMAFLSALMMLTACSSQSADINSIGSNAKLQKANFKEEYCVSIDDEYLVKVPEGSSTVDVYSPTSWQTRWLGQRKLGTMQVPANFYLADARQAIPALLAICTMKIRIFLVTE